MQNTHEPNIVAIVCLSSSDFLSQNISAFYLASLQRYLDAFVHIRDFLAGHKLLLLWICFGILHESAL